MYLIPYEELRTLAQSSMDEVALPHKPSKIERIMGEANRLVTPSKEYIRNMWIMGD